MSAVQHRRRGTRPAKNKRPLTREAIDRAVAIYPCATDGASIAGLVPLRRRHPRNWAIILSAGLPLRSVPPEMSTGEFVHLGAKGLLLPRDERDGSLRKRRSSAARLLSYIEDVRLSDWDEDRLEEIGRAYFHQECETRRRSQVLVDLTLLRRIVRRALIALGRSPVQRRWNTRWPRVPAERTRPALPLPQFALLLLALDREPDVRAIAGLLTGTGVDEALILGLRLQNLDAQLMAFRISGRNARGMREGLLERWVPVPLWAWELLVDWVNVCGGRKPTELLFPARGNTRRPRSSILRPVRKAAFRAGVVPEGDPDRVVTPTALRRIFQSVAIPFGLAKGVVRGTTGIYPEDPLGPALSAGWYHEASRLSTAWTDLVLPPVESTEIRRLVPARAPRGTKAHEPETEPSENPLSASRSKWASRPLPASCSMPGPGRADDQGGRAESTHHQGAHDKPKVSAERLRPPGGIVLVSEPDGDGPDLRFMEGSPERFSAAGEVQEEANSPESSYPLDQKTSVSSPESLEPRGTAPAAVTSSNRLGTIVTMTTGGLAIKCLIDGLTSCSDEPGGSDLLQALSRPIPADEDDPR